MVVAPVAVAAAAADGKGLKAMKRLVLSTMMAAVLVLPAQPAHLAEQVRHELVMLPFYSVFDHLMFEVNGPRVTLMGQVSRPTLKTDAEHVVKRIEGVESVVNRIEVLPVSNHDDRIRLALYRALYGHQVLHRYLLHPVPPIHIIVRNGDVTLVGSVASEAEKNTAGILANSVSGVFSVTNNLQVDPT